MPHPPPTITRRALVLYLAVALGLPTLGCAALISKAGTKTRYAVDTARCVQADPRLGSIYRDNAASIERLQSKIDSMEQVGQQIAAGRPTLTAEQSRQYLDTLDLMKRVQYCLRVGRPGGDVGAARAEVVGS